MKKSGFRTASGEKFACLSPEDMPVNVKLCFTINPAEQLPKADREVHTKNLLEYGKAHLYACLGKLCYSVASLNVELSKTGRLHWHGYLTVKDIKGFYLNDMPLLQKFGTYEIHKEEDLKTDKEIKYKTWGAYITKQSNIWGKEYINVFVPKKLEQLEKNVTAKKTKLEKLCLKHDMEAPEDDTVGITVDEDN